MIQIHSDVSHLSTPKVHIRFGGQLLLSDKRPIKLKSQWINSSDFQKNVMGSTAEDEIGDTYINAPEDIPIRTYLIEMDHPNPTTPIQVGNYSPVGFSNKAIKKKYPNQ